MVEFFAFLQQLILVAEFVKDLIELFDFVVNWVSDILYWLVK